MSRGGRYTYCGPGPCDTLTWEEMYGTSLDGNLPQYKRAQHIGNMWMPCPYSTQAVLDFSRWPELYGVSISEYEDTFGPVDPNSRIIAMLGFVPPTLVDHTIVVPIGSGTITKEVYLKPVKKGSWGYECTFPGCPHYLDTGKRYFYI